MNAPGTSTNYLAPGDGIQTVWLGNGANSNDPFPNSRLDYQFCDTVTQSDKDATMTSILIISSPGAHSDFNATFPIVEIEVVTYYRFIAYPETATFFRPSFVHMDVDGFQDMVDACFMEFAESSSERTLMRGGASPLAAFRDLKLLDFPKYVVKNAVRTVSRALGFGGGSRSLRLSRRLSALLSEMTFAEREDFSHLLSSSRDFLIYNFMLIFENPPGDDEKEESSRAAATRSGSQPEARSRLK
jgi:hypothetical protein